MHKKADQKYTAVVVFVNALDSGQYRAYTLKSLPASQ